MEWSGEKIKELREKLGKTKAEFAGMLHTTPTTVYRWEKKISRPHKSVLISLEQIALGRLWGGKRIKKLVDERDRLKREIVLRNKQNTIDKNRMSRVKKRVGKELKLREFEMELIDKMFKENFRELTADQLIPLLTDALGFLQAEIQKKDKNIDRLRKAFYRVEESIDLLKEHVRYYPK